MPRSSRSRWFFCSALLAGLLLFGCGESPAKSGGDVGADGDSETGLTEDGEGEAGDDESEVDTPSEVDEALEQDLGLPDSLAVQYTRPDASAPVSGEEVREFTKKVLAFLKNIHYFDYLLYTTYGVDASTGKKDWQFWYSENFRKEGDKVVFYHSVNLNNGGHNLHEPMSRVLGDAIAAYLLIGDPAMALASEKLCKGFSASMLGMVHDGNDPLKHLMSRNIAAFDHEFKTHDGKKKGVDYSGWFSSYEVWNANRFPYEDNPYWGKIWVTNIRSKDDVPNVFRLVPILRYAAERAPDAAVKDACAETLDLLERFARDIVETDFRIRSKDKNGEVFIPGYTGDPELNKKQGDLASYINYRQYIPKGECNARRGAELVAHHKATIEDCGRGEPNAYDSISFSINGYNKGICRYYHVAHLANALVNRDDAAALKLLDGLNERITLEEAVTEKGMKCTPEEWRQDLALYLAQSHAYGFPLTNDEVRLIHGYYLKAVDELAAWPYWDPWAESVPPGELGSYRPPSCKGAAETQQCWWRVEDLAQIFETCWSPFLNPASAPLVDCGLVRDPAVWQAF